MRRGSRAKWITWQRSAAPGPRSRGALRRPLYEGGPAVKCALVVEVDLLVGEGFELGSSLYGAVAGDRLGGSSSGSAIQFGAVMRPRTPGRLPEQRVRSWSACARSPRPDVGRSRPRPASSPARGRG